jgi:hypothetical protein
LTSICATLGLKKFVRNSLSPLNLCMLDENRENQSMGEEGDGTGSDGV